MILALEGVADALLSVTTMNVRTRRRIREGVSKVTGTLFFVGRFCKLVFNVRQCFSFYLDVFTPLAP